MKKLSLAASIIFTSITSLSVAQFSDSLKIQIGTKGTIAANSYQPLWLVSNKYGTIADRKMDLSTDIKITNRHTFSSNNNDSSNNNFYINYGLHVFNNQHFSKVFIEEGYLKTGYKNWQLRAGRFEEITGEVDKDLSTGSLGVSGNAIPIPKVGIAVVDYTPIPFTNGWLQFKGQLSHGWFGNDRYMKDAFYHEKTFYLQVGKKKLKLYAGVQHFAEWGGRRGNVQLERSFKGFMDVLLVREADDGSVGTAVTGLPPNRPGDQRGLLEAGFTWDGENIALHAYHQTPFETGRDVDVRNIDRLAGLSVAFKNKGAKILLEVLDTKDMLSFVPQFDRQSFYNNGYYRTGWEYQSKIIGNSLFTNRTRANKYYSDITPFDWSDDNTPGNSNIVNNRIIGLHLGGMYSILQNLSAKTLVTYTRNYGTHGNSIFTPHKNQWYTLQEMSFNLPKPGLSLTAGVAFDKGELSDNVGFIFGVRKEFKNL